MEEIITEPCEVCGDSLHICDCAKEQREKEVRKRVQEEGQLDIDPFGEPPILGTSGYKR